MKKIIALLCVLFTLGCGSSLTIDGVEHDTVGIFTLDERDPDVCYTTIVGNVIWSVLLSETLVMPVYFIGFSIMEPTDRTFCHHKETK